jgi:hypothetical protein
MIYATNWQCINLDASTPNCAVTATSTEATATSTEAAQTCGTATGTPCVVATPVTYSDWIFISTIQVFLMSFICLGMVMSLFRRKIR